MILYEQNIQILMQLTYQEKYDKEVKITIAFYDGKEIYLTEFLYAKQRGLINDFRGHEEIEKNYFKLLPYLFSHNLFDETYQNLDNHRLVYSIFDGDGRRIFHILDEENFLVSVYVISEDRFKRQINKKFKFVANLSERAVISSILSPAGPFWRQTDLIEELYTHFSKSCLTIDSSVYKLYNLTDKEIVIIENKSEKRES